MVDEQGNGEGGFIVHSAPEGGAGGSEAHWRLAEGSVSSGVAADWAATQAQSRYGVQSMNGFQLEALALAGGESGWLTRLDSSAGRVNQALGVETLKIREYFKR
jgi:hypothetical protein